MAQSKLYPVVMAGGSGSRLWPLSRVLYPKQFLCLKGDLTMLQTTICRLNGVECESPVVICNERRPLYCRGTAASTEQTHREHYSQTGRA
ncbi:sugar phosphate nucleotidyltransferase [Escherichia coli]